MWFETLTGFREKSPTQVRRHLIHDGETLTSRVNGRSFRCGKLSLPSLAELREAAAAAGGAGRTSVAETVADVRALHADPANAGALFQVASQFNLLEMTAPEITPEWGVDIYEDDHTQGPACATAAGAGTIVRNYFVEVDGQVGQTAARQLDALADLGRALGNEDGSLWTMRNGYALATREGLDRIAARLAGCAPSERDALRTLLRVGLHRDTQVTLRGCDHLVTQVYASALPVAYGEHAPASWEPFARLVLEAAYEATLAAGVLNAAATGNPAVHLTLLGGGAFGNAEGWILDALVRAVLLHRDTGLQVRIVSYKRPRPGVGGAVARLHEAGIDA